MNLTPKSPLIDGVSAELSDGTTVVVAPFNIRRSKALATAFDALEQAQGMGDRSKGIAMKMALVKIALSANYPEITDEIIEELRPIDLDLVIAALTEANKSGEAKAPANPTGAEQPSPTGTDS